MRRKESNISSIINQLSDQEARWFAIYTKYKCEKYVADQLSRKGISVYLPLIQKVKRYTSKIKRYDVPLINCYAFVKIKKDDYVRVLETEYVLKFIKQRKNLIAIPENEMLLLKRIVGEIEDLNAGDIRYEAGDEVEIISGNLTGIRGILLRDGGKNKFVVQLISIGLQLEMVVDIQHLKLVKRRA